MASVSAYAGGYSVKWHYPANKQHHCRLAGFDRDQALEAADHVEALIRAARSRRKSVGYATLRYLQNDAPRGLVSRLVACALYDDRRAIRDAVDAFITDNVRAVSADRLDDMQRILDQFVRLVGRSVAVADLTRDDVDRWADYQSDLAPSTQGKQAAIVRKFFSWCASERLLEVSPAAHLDRKTFAAEARREVSAAEFAALLAVVDRVSADALTLARFAGLRVGEICRLTWDAYDAEAAALHVIDTKRDRVRRVPVMDPVREVLERTKPGVRVAGRRVLDHGGDGGVTRSTLDGRIRAAALASGVSIWPRLFHNLRATLQTEWIKAFGLVNACHWIGNSQTVAAKHYAMATEAAFRAATGRGDQ
jgi:integrase